MWTSSVSGNVKIELFTSAGDNSTIIASTGNTGSYAWAISSGQSERMDDKIRVPGWGHGVVSPY